jgi:hypothetical protein
MGKSSAGVSGKWKINEKNKLVTDHNH